MRRILIGVAASLMLVGVAGPATARPGNAGPPDGVVPGDQTIAEIVVEAASGEPDAEFTLLLDALV